MDAYELIERKHLKDLNSEGLVFSHIKSGARVIFVKNDDNNKVFSIAFRTPSVASNGVQHITEHSVLCGSRKYPAKEPFVELAKGSLNTFLNAMTYPDKTVYPVASCNLTDFKNLTDVYLDAVFYPNTYKRPEIFKQEGWHYESDGTDVTLNGVVFNEMKGAYSSPDDVLQNGIFESLFPDCPYRFDSGGNPEVIPDLTYEDFIDYHKKHYHPANSYIYMYGDLDVEERLEYLDKEYLGAFDKADLTHDTSLPEQKAFDKPVTNAYPYAVLPDEAGEDKSYLSYSWITGKAVDDELCIALDVLDYVLISAPGAVLKQKLLDERIATDISSSFETSLCQPVYSVIAKNADAKNEERFKKIIDETLKEVLENGFDEDMLLAGINSLEFRYREADFGHYPKGLIYNLAMLDSWIYDEKLPFVHVESGRVFEKLKSLDMQSYFKDILKKYLIDNKTAASVTLVPDPGLDAKRREAEVKRIKDYTDTLSPEELEKIKADTQELKAYQATPSTDEELETIPLLSLDDIDRNPIPIEYEVSDLDGTEYVTEDIFTNSIYYLTFAFDAKHVSDEYLPYMGLLNIVSGLMDTADHSYTDLNSLVNKNTGGIFTDISIRRNVNNYDEMRIFFDIKAKCLYDKLGDAVSLTKEIIFKTDFSDKKRLKEIIAKTVSQLEDSVMAAGHTTASSVALSQFSSSRHFASVTRGYEFFRFLKELDADFEARADDAISKLNELTALIFNRESLIINLTADKEGKLKAEEQLKEFIKALPQVELKEAGRVFEKTKTRVGLSSPAQVNYVCRAGNFKDAGFEYTGAMKVLKTIFAYEYLWNNVRVLGGAYGCMNEFGRSGDTFFVSYRDPNLTETEEIFKKAPEFVKSFEVTRRDMDKYIIGTIGALDTPLTPSTKGARAFDAYLKNFTTELLKEERAQILECDSDAVRALAPVVEAVIDDGYFCAVGNAGVLEANKDKFDKISTLC